jgi:DNA modification methylase
MTTKLLIGDCRTILPTLPSGSVHCVVTSPPYWGLRDYGVDGAIGLEPTLAEHIFGLVDVFRELRRVLRPDGTCWLNYGDSYNAGTTALRKPTHTGKHGYWKNPRINQRINLASLKPKDLCMISSRLAIALQEDGWWVRSEIIWHKLNPMPESVTDRPTSSHEKVFLLTKSARYFYDAGAVREKWADDRQGRDGSRKTRERNRGGRNDGFTKPNGIDPSVNGGRNLRNVWTVATEPFSEAHFATFPTALVEPCIKAGCPLGGCVLDPFAGAGTVGLVADRLERTAILIELNPEYARMAQERINKDAGLFANIHIGGQDGTQHTDDGNQGRGSSAGEARGPGEGAGGVPRGDRPQGPQRHPG